MRRRCEKNPIDESTNKSQKNKSLVFSVKPCKIASDWCVYRKANKHTQTQTYNSPKNSMAKWLYKWGNETRIV